MLDILLQSAIPTRSVALGRAWSGALSWWGITIWHVLFRTPDLTDLHFFPHAFLDPQTWRPLAGHERGPLSCERVADLLYEVRGRAAP